MPNKVWLLVDCHNLCWRAFHTTGGLSYQGMPTGVSFGLLRDLEFLKDHFVADRLILAFDGESEFGVGKRQEIFPDYKITRRTKEYTEQERATRKGMVAEMRRLRDELLPNAGYMNILRVNGYEADDIIAKVANELPTGVDAVIVSTDKDLWQCLTEHVVCYNPISKRVLTVTEFMEKWGLHPVEWASVKAVAGCASDDVPGLDGVGDITAAKWFRGLLKPHTEAYQTISANIDIIARNMPLVRLPFPGLELPPLRDDYVTVASLDAVRKTLGIQSRPLDRDRGFV